MRERKQRIDGILTPTHHLLRLRTHLVRSSTEKFKNHFESISKTKRIHSSGIMSSKPSWPGESELGKALKKVGSSISGSRIKAVSSLAIKYHKVRVLEGQHVDDGILY